jgi:hypothetical protein
MGSRAAVPEQAEPAKSPNVAALLNLCNAWFAGYAPSRWSLSHQ